VLTTVVAGVGSIITLLAVGILALSLFLLVQKNRRTISGLLMLGYPTGAVARGYLLMVGAVNAAVLVLSSAALPAVESLWTGPLEAIGLDPAPVWPVLAAALVIMAVITLFNAVVIRRLVGKCFR